MDGRQRCHPVSRDLGDLADDARRQRLFRKPIFVPGRLRLVALMAEREQADLVKVDPANGRRLYGQMVGRSDKLHDQSQQRQTRRSETTAQA